MPTFPDVTLLITHYNRSSSLERLLKAFSDLDCNFEDIVVSDDGSRPEHLEQLSSINRTYPYRLVSTPVNKGLGNNINKGQDAVRTKYTLYIQEDFVPKSIFPANLAIALKLMQQREEIDMVRFYAYFKYPYLKSIGQGFSEMVFRFSAPGYRKFYYYSDHPHLRRTSFFEKFGRYPEGIKVEATEYKMMISFLKNKGKALQYNDPSALFDQLNSPDEPSTVSRNKWRVNTNPVIAFLRHLYRHIKFNYDYLR